MNNNNQQIDRVQALEKSYDCNPYPGESCPRSHPRHLEVVARLFGLKPANSINARVLELGCASGENLIPMAAQSPNLKCVGIDLSNIQVKAGMDDIKALGLSNISLITMSISDITPDLGQFDYIIAHGVYSWVPSEIQSHVLRVMKENLTPNGVAYVSYNILPGWSSILPLRESMLFHVAKYKDPEERITEAVKFLEFLLNSQIDGDTAWKRTIETELLNIKSKDRWYVYHDHLENENNPIYFNEFVKRANNTGLRYLGDSDLNSMYVNNLPDHVSGPLSQIKDVVEKEQYVDFVRNRRFRQTLLVHDNKTPNFDVPPQKILDFSLTSNNLAPDFNVSVKTFKSDQTLTFSKGAISFPDKAAAALYGLLHEQGNQPITSKRLVSKATKITGGNAQTRKAILDTGMRLVFSGNLILHASSYDDNLRVSNKPEVWKLARHQSSMRTRITTQRHEMVTLDDELARNLAILLDGSRTITDAVDILFNKIKANDFLFRNEQGVVLNDNLELRKSVENRVMEIVIWFSRNALLTGA